MTGPYRFACAFSGTGAGDLPIASLLAATLAWEVSIPYVLNYTVPYMPGKKYSTPKLGAGKIRYVSDTGY